MWVLNERHIIPSVMCTYLHLVYGFVRSHYYNGSAVLIPMAAGMQRA